VRKRILIAAAIVTSGWLGACSKPTSSNGQESDAMAEKGARQIELADPASQDGAVVSDLEAGRATERTLVQTRKGRSTTPAARVGTPAVDQAVTPPTEHVHTLSMTTSSAPDPVLRLATAPAAPVFGVARAADGSELHPMPGNNWLPDAVNRGPTIIIRGGMGRPDDDCDELNPRGRRGGGAAVNRLAPPTTGSGGRTSFRGGIR
jgi:hypothetical protein